MLPIFFWVLIDGSRFKLKSGITKEMEMWQTTDGHADSDPKILHLHVCRPPDMKLFQDIMWDICLIELRPTQKEKYVFFQQQTTIYIRKSSFCLTWGCLNTLNLIMNMLQHSPLRVSVYLCACVSHHIVSGYVHALPQQTQLFSGRPSCLPSLNRLITALWFFSPFKSQLLKGFSGKAPVGFTGPFTKLLCGSTQQRQSLICMRT